ncbi:MAG: hypothetical protein O3A63_21385, partial [Proteobacteria bacterium]|nr:hypothetical protein [Pseudomonadota bacterium]
MNAEISLRSDFIQAYPNEAVETLGTLAGADLADELSGLEIGTLSTLLERLPASRAADLFGNLEVERQTLLLGTVVPRIGVGILSWLDPPN